MHVSSNPMNLARQEFVNSLEAAIQEVYGNVAEKQVVEQSIALPQQKADMSSSLCFRLAKDLKKNPKEIAEHIAEKLKPKKLIEEYVAVNGYINANFDKKEYTRLVLATILDKKDAYGNSSLGNDTKIIVESPSVNPNKPLHVGHLRNALLGDAVSNSLSACGFSVERENYIDDLGLQVAESLWGYTNLENKPDKKFDIWLGEQYVLVNKILKEKPETAEQINSLLKRMEEQDNEDASKAREFAEKCVHAQYETLAQYDIAHDVLVWESDVVRAKLLEKAIAKMKDSNVVHVEKEGKYKDCLVISIEKFKGMSKELEGLEEEKKVLVRSNGAATYLAKDIAFHMWKAGIIDVEFDFAKFMQQWNGKTLYSSVEKGEKMDFGKAARIINVIGSSQNYPQIVLKNTFKLMGYEGVYENSMHLSYGEISLESGAFHGRSGNWLSEGRNYTADDLFKEVKSKALEIISNAGKIKNAEEGNAISSAIALAAIKFEFLRVAPEKRITFSWEKALNFEGNSGPYCMYTYARASRILEKEKPNAISDSDFEQITSGKDFELIKLMSLLPDSIEKMANEHRPNVIVDYLLSIAALFSKFYEAMPVIKGGEAKNLRLSMLVALKICIENGLAILSIKPIEKM